MVRVFENDVEMYGAQARKLDNMVKKLFENDVEMYGAQAAMINNNTISLFENDVEMYGAQASKNHGCHDKRLRMM